LECSLQKKRKESLFKWILTKISIIIQGILLPFLVCFELFLLAAPLLSYISVTSTSPLVINWTSPSWIFWIILCILWVPVILASFQLSFRFAYYKNKLFRPWNLYLLAFWSVIDTIRGRGKVWKFYKWLLADNVQRCYKLHSRCCCGCIAEVLLFFLIVLWAGWPCLFPILFKQYIYLSITAPVTIGLLYRTTKILRDNWKKDIQREVENDDDSDEEENSTKKSQQQQQQQQKSTNKNRNDLEKGYGHNRHNGSKNKEKESSKVCNAAGCYMQTIPNTNYCQIHFLEM